MDIVYLLLLGQDNEGVRIRKQHVRLGVKMRRRHAEPLMGIAEQHSWMAPSPGAKEMKRAQTNTHPSIHPSMAAKGIIGISSPPLLRGVRRGGGLNPVYTVAAMTLIHFGRASERADF